MLLIYRSCAGFMISEKKNTTRALVDSAFSGADADTVKDRGRLMKPFLTQSDSASRIRPFLTGCFFDWILRVLRPFLTQSDSASRKRPFSTGLFFDWILLVLLIVSRVDFIVFVLFLEAVGVREYCCMYSRRNRLAALCFALSPRATARRTFVPASRWLWA